VYAAIYQFVVLAMIFAASGLTSLVSTLLKRSRVCYQRSSSTRK
jgi:putative ABC transport system permease protein